MKERIVCVEWEDASFNSGYYDKKEPEKFTPTKTKTAGFLIKSDKDCVLIAQDRFYDKKDRPEDERHISIIPKKMIIKITVLEGE